MDFRETYQDINAETLRLAENAPMIQPMMVPTTDSSRKNNNLLGKTFQFAYQWVYKDYRHSILSPYSDIFVSKELANEIVTYDNSLENKITVTCPQGNSEVRQINLLAREGNSGSWFYCNKYVRSEHKENAAAVFDFYDDSAREYIDITSALATYHNVPLSAENIEVVSNKIVLSECLTGYDPTDPVYDLSVEYGEANPSATVTVIPVEFVFSPLPKYHSKLQIKITAPALTKGQTAIIDIRWDAELASSNSAPINHAYALRTSIQYYAASNKTASEVRDWLLQLISNKITCTRSFKNVPWEGATIPSGTEDFPYTVMSLAPEPYIRIDIPDMPSFLPAPSAPGGYYYSPPVGVSNSQVYLGGAFQSTFKSYSSYNVGIAYFDKVGRTSGVLTCKEKAVYIPGTKERAVGNIGRAAYIKYVLHSPPPSWASYYRMYVTESINLLDAWATGSNSNCHEVEHEGFTVLALDLFTSGYAYKQGDVLIKETATGVITKPILTTKSLVTVGTTDYSGNFILVPKGTDTADGTAIASDGNYAKSSLLIHRPKSVTEGTVYFEDLATGTISNGAHSYVSGVIKCGDAWIKSKIFTYKEDTPYTITGEEFDVNFELGVRAYAKGRPLVSLADFGQKQQPIVMWGGNSFIGTRVNDVAEFNFEDTMMLDVQHGKITGMTMVGDVMKFLQFRKDTSVYVGKSTFTDAGGNVSLSQVNSLFGNKNESETDYGCNFNKAYAVCNRLLFYWDQDKGAVVQSSPNGILEISRYKMQSYFRSKKRQIDVAIKDGRFFEVAMGYNAKFNELMVLFYIDNGISPIFDIAVFGVDMNRWTMFLDINKTVGSRLYYPDEFMSLGSSICFTLAGMLYQWNSEDLQIGENNVLCDEIKPLSITSVLNDVPIRDKELKDASIDCDGFVYMQAETPPTVTCPVGQFTYNNQNTWRNKSGRRTSAFFKSVRVANGSSNSSLLHSGRSMQGRWAFISVKSSNPRGFELRDLEVNWQLV